MTTMKAADLPLDYNAVAILEHNLASRPDKIAVYTDEREVSFAQLCSEVNQVGGALLRLGVQPGECVGLLCLDCVEWVAAYFGILKIGAVAVCINTLLRPPEHAYILRDARVRVLLGHASLLPALAQVRAGLPALTHVVAIGGDAAPPAAPYAEWIAAEPTTLAAVRTHREDPAALHYSSGTTGEPKGILHAHKDYPLSAALIGRNTFGLDETDRTFAAAKLFFTYGNGGNLMFPFHAGAAIVLLPGPARVHSSVLRTIERFRPTVHFNSPTGYAALLAVPGFPGGYDLSSLRLCVSAGEALPAPIWHAWKARTGVDILDGLGSSENYHMFISNRPGDIRPGSSGRVIPGYGVKLVDDDGHPVPQGEIGHLWVQGETAALSYLHQYARSKQTFQGEWMVTGDKYYVDQQGYYWHAGRSDDMLKVGGIWVSPVEVESTLIAHQAVLECAVVGHDDGSGLCKPRAYVVLKDGYQGSAELAAALIDHCKALMADYKRPRWIDFVAELPKTATGKIQRFRLR